MTLVRVSIVIDDKLWKDSFEDQMNALEQGVMNARGYPKKYPMIVSEWEGE